MGGWTRSWRGKRLRLWGDVVSLVPQRRGRESKGREKVAWQRASWDLLALKLDNKKLVSNSSRGRRDAYTTGVVFADGFCGIPERSQSGSAAWSRSSFKSKDKALKMEKRRMKILSVSCREILMQGERFMLVAVAFVLRMNCRLEFVMPMRK